MWSLELSRDKQRTERENAGFYPKSAQNGANSGAEHSSGSCRKCLKTLGILKKKSQTEKSLAKNFGGGKGFWVQIHSPTSLGKCSAFVLTFGDCPFHIVATIDER